MYAVMVPRPLNALAGYPLSRQRVAAAAASPREARRAAAAGGAARVGAMAERRRRKKEEEEIETLFDILEKANPKARPREE